MFQPASRRSLNVRLFSIANYNKRQCPPSLACQVRDRTGRICFGNDLCIVALYASKTKSTAEALRRCFCFAEVSTGHPHPLRRRVPYVRRWWVKIPHRWTQELKLPTSVDGVARSNQASLLELCSLFNYVLLPIKIYTKISKS